MRCATASTSSGSAPEARFFQGAGGQPHAHCTGHRPHLAPPLGAGRHSHALVCRPVSPTGDVARGLREVFATRLTRPLAWRRGQLDRLALLLDEGAPQLTAAMARDMGKPELEAWLTDVAAVRRDVVGVASALASWAAPRPVPVPWALWPGRAAVVPEPLGAVLVIGPWNYPVRCLLLPLAFALAAGNTVALKPSELAPATSAAIAELVSRYLDPRAVVLVEGGPEVAAALLAQRWDHIFFTGGGATARLVMAAAASNLTPVTLELGGKNPAIVDATAGPATVAKRLVWGKFLNAGQTCVAPDYVLVERRAEKGLLDALRARVERSFGADPRQSPDLGRIVNDAHMARLQRMLAETSGRAVVGGTSDPADRYVAPTVLAGVSWDDAVMQEEIFGPVLPVLAYDDVGAALEEVARRDKPIAVYLYSRDRSLAERVLAETSSGGVCVNHNAVQLAVPGLPFGGVGASGMGAYHGRAGFDTFSHAKSVLRRSLRAELALMYPPYTGFKRWVLKKVL
jgi:aldehyde dehydrogenase (NAD+)